MSVSCMYMYGKNNHKENTWRPRKSYLLRSSTYVLKRHIYMEKKRNEKEGGKEKAHNPLLVCLPLIF